VAHNITLKGMTWSDPRGYDPVVSAAAAFADRHPGVRIDWDKRSLQGFESTPVDELAAAYDLMVIDHPHVGAVAGEGCLLPLDRHGSAYVANPYDFAYSVSLPGFVAPPGGVPAFTVDAMRKYDLADRRAHKLDLSATVALSGRGAPSFEQAYRRGLALSVSLQEYLAEAEQAFRFSRAVAKTKEEQGRAMWGLATIAGKRGQTDDALKLLDQAEALLGELPSTWKTRGDIYAQVWRWPLAAEAYRRASQLAPADVTVWQMLAMSEASSGRYAEALEAAQAGIKLFPRDADCLRVQALSLAQLGAPEAIREKSLAVALEWRLPDDGPSSKGKCSKRIVGCAERRNPVPRYQAVPTGPLAGLP